MSQTVRNRLHASIYAEHLEEAAFWYAQRWAWLEDPTLDLDAIATLERRHEAHVDGLISGAPETLDACVEAVSSGLPAELHVGLRVACACAHTPVVEILTARLMDSELLEDTRRELELAASRAFARSLPPSWGPLLSRRLFDRRLGPVIAAGLSPRADFLGPALLQAAVAHGAEVDVRLVRALGDLGHVPARAQLRALLGEAAAPSLWSASAIACLKLGDPEVAGLVARDPEVAAWGPEAQVHVLDSPSAWLHAALDRAPHPALFRAIALRGDPGSVPVLRELLSDATFGDEATAALTTIAGSSVAPASMAAHTAHTSMPGVRHRLGQPWSPTLARTSWASFALPLETRAAIRDELMIRLDERPPPATAPAHTQVSYLGAHT